jgi:hypothetical protein
MSEIVLTDSNVKRRYQIQMDETGCPVMLADVPGAGVSRVDPDATSGNPRHDIRSGKFGRGGAGGRREPPPANVDPIEYARMIDAVRDAAREFDSPDVGDVKEFLAGRAKAPDKVDIQQFLTLVQEQRKSDAVDILDQQLRSSGVLPRGRRKVRVAAPRGYVRRLIGSLDGDQLGEIMHRLAAKGHDPEDVDKFFNGKVKDDVAETARSRRDSFQASDWQGDPFEDVEFAEGGVVPPGMNLLIDDSYVIPISADELAERIAMKLSAIGSATQ